VSTAAELPAAEARLLRTLRGHPLDSLSTDGWAVYLRSGTRTLAFVPEELDGPDEILLPDADVVRLRVEDRHAETRAEPITELSAGLGTIRRLARMTAAVAFRLPLVSGPAGADAAGPEAEEPPGGGLTPLYFHPDDLEAAGAGFAGATAQSLVDVGVAIEADRGWAVIATDGWSFRVLAALEGRAEEALAPLTGKIRLTPLFATAGQPA
jgi:hypothetical protein